MAGAQLAHLYVFDGAEGIGLEHRPEEADWLVIQDGRDGSIRFLAEDLPPPLTEKDTVIRDDEAWKAGSVDYKKIPELAGVEREKYRGLAREEVRVTMVKQ